MAIQGLSLAKVIEYISEQDTCKDEADGASVFLFRSLTADERAYVADSTLTFQGGMAALGGGGGGSVRMNAGTQQFLAVKLSLIGWRNFQNEKSKDIEFKTAKFTLSNTGRVKDCVDDDTLSALSPELMTEFGTMIISSNFMNEEQRKNLNTA